MASLSEYLVLDSRETHMAPFIESELRGRYIKKQINTGDALVYRRRGKDNPLLLACVERKTIADFAGGFKDGRYENYKKMLALRESTKCALYYIIEGPAFPNLNRNFARVPFSKVLAAITGLMVRHGIMIIQTEDPAHSAKRLRDLVYSYCDSVSTPVFEGVAIAVATAAEPAPGENLDNKELEPSPMTVDAELTKRIELRDDEIATQVWDRLLGISVVLGKLLTAQFSVAALARGDVSVAQIQALKTASGKTLRRDAIASLKAVRADSRDTGIRLLSGVTGISPAMATQILDSTGSSFKRLCSYSVATMAMIRVGTTNRNLGEKRAARIKTVLEYVEGAAPVPAAPKRPALKRPAAKRPTIDDPFDQVYEEAPAVAVTTTSTTTTITSDELDNILGF